MLEITLIENLEKVHHYEVLYFRKTHIEFMKFLRDFGFSENEIIKADVLFLQ